MRRWRVEVWDGYISFGLPGPNSGVSSRANRAEVRVNALPAYVLGPGPGELCTSKNAFQ